VKKSRPSLSIVIPTFKEAANINPLVNRLAALSFEDRLFEVLLIDDNSNDGTVDIVNQLRQQYPWLQLVVRQAPRGLSRSVLNGFELASYDLLVVLDADLSHHPEKIPELLLHLEQPETDMVIGSRYVDGGKIDSDWPLHRIAISKLSAWAARFLLRLPIKDPLSGFIGIKREVMNRAKDINPIGWKIGLELMVRCRCQTITEIPISFSERHAGYSKLTLHVGMNYLKQLAILFFYKLKDRTS
jgi:dolichol-phosphate mannosyltransferase